VLLNTKQIIIHSVVSFQYSSYNG